MTRFRRSGTNWEGRQWRTSAATNSLMDEIEARYPTRHPADGTVASERHDEVNPFSDHRPFPYTGPGVVNAVDAGETDEGEGEELFQALRASQDPRIRYVIHERRLFSSYTSSTGVPPWTVRPYGGAGHLDHVHTSVLRTHQDDGSAWRLFEEEDMPLSDEDIARIWAHLIPVTTPAGQSRKAEVILESLRNDVHRVIGLINALDIEGVSEEELDERVDHLLALLPDRTVDRIRDRLATPA